MPSELSTGFLVAAPNLLDPNFARSVVLLVQHQQEGSFGFVVNREAPVSFQELADELGLSEEGSGGQDLLVLNGGPVAPDTGWLVFDSRQRTELPEDSVLRVTETLCVSTSMDLLSELAKATPEESRRHLLVLGYAGWAPGQLEVEIREGTWIPVDLDEDLLFDAEVGERWARALGLAGINPLHLVGMPSAQA